jgi:Fe2+ transport system protein FeoA
VRYGSTVNGFIETGRGCGVVVPVPALVARGQDTFVQRVQNGRVETRRVRLGLVEGGQVQIVEGLAEGDTIVARAGAFLRDGDVVRPVETPPAQVQAGQGASAAQAAGARP